jgi:hypothetical protein
MSLSALMQASAELEALGKANQKVKLTDMSGDELLSQHDTLKAERIAMSDDLPAQERAALTNRVKRIEGELRSRGIEFDALPQANQPRAIAEMEDEELVAEYKQIFADYDAATPGKKSSYTTRLKAIKAEVGKRLEAATQEVEPAEETAEVTDEVNTEEVTEEPAVEVPAEAATATATKRTTRRRRS